MKSAKGGEEIAGADSGVTTPTLNGIMEVRERRTSLPITDRDKVANSTRPVSTTVPIDTTLSTEEILILVIEHQEELEATILETAKRIEGQINTDNVEVIGEQVGFAIAESLEAYWTASEESLKNETDFEITKEMTYHYSPTVEKSIAYQARNVGGDVMSLVLESVLESVYWPQVGTHFAKRVREG